jgi:predicted ATPase
VAENSNLPATTTRVVGRAEIIELLQREVVDARLVSIVGPGGIGKTTVALAVAEQAIESFEDGVWLVDFAPLKDLSLVPHAIAAATGLVVHSANIMAALSRFLRGRRTLLVLDNCEHMADGIAPCVAQILDEAGGVHFLTTSRAPLRVFGEQVRRLPGLALPAVSSDLTVADALTFSAIELFVERATDRVESFTLSDADTSAVADICRELDGIALAIELAAMRVDVFGVLGLQKQIGDRFRLLAGSRAGLERHRTLAATLDWSYGLLRADEAALLRTVSVFSRAFRLGDAASIASLSTSETATILAELAAQSLLSADADPEAGADAGGRDGMYRLLETTRAYCLEKLLASGEDQRVRLRHAEYIGEVIEGAAGEVGRRPAREWGMAYGRYLDDLRAALAFAGADRAHRALLVRLTAAGTVLWNHLSLTDESRTHLERATLELQEERSAGTAVEMNLQLALAGAILYTRGIVPEARAAMGRASEIAVQRNDTECQLGCLRMIGTYELFSGDNAAGIQTLEAFVTLAAAVDPSALAEGETHLGCGELFIGRFGSSRRRLERLYAQGLLDLNDASSLRFLYNHSMNIMIVLSHAQWMTGSPGAAVQTAEELVEYGLEAGHELSLSIGLAWVSLVFFWAGRDEDCRRHTAMLDDLTETHGIVTWRPVATFCRGALASRRAETLSEGIADLKRTVAECRAIGHMARLPYFIGVLAEALARQGALQEAEATILESIELAKEQKDYCNLPELLRIQAFVLGAQGQPEKQEAMLIESMALCETNGAASWRLRAGIDLARLWQAQSRAAEAKRMLQPAFEIFTDGLDTRDLVTAARLLEELQ